jgi:hypothetical protein
MQWFFFSHDDGRGAVTEASGAGQKGNAVPWLFFLQLGEKTILQVDDAIFHTKRGLSTESLVDSPRFFSPPFSFIP